MTAHTPGPWHYTSEFEAKEFCGLRLMTIDGEPVGQHTGDKVIAYMRPFGNQYQIHADACLIVAAPKLLKALKAMVKATELWNESVEAIIGRQPKTHIDLIDAHAAIASAESGAES